MSSEEEPFQSSGSEYIPSDENIPGPSHANPRLLLNSKTKSKKLVKKKQKIDVPPKQGKKRIRCPDKWQKNVRKIKKAKGEMHV